ncbi:MAG: N-acetyl sugar amidotransferase [Candidatus Sericytochromatia bacterium]|nr:N-acetyl sugar amidotransferase [Candidatus Sericytochromatia bacterium]
MLMGQRILANEVRLCSRCIYDATLPGIKFDHEGVCTYCRMIEGLEAEFKTGTPEGERKFEGILDQIKADGRGKRYDCIIGVSGGTDSSWLMHHAVRTWGLRPLAVHYDNTWNSAIATINIQRVLKPLGVDLFTYVADNVEIDDIHKAFFLAGVPELDGPTDIAAPQVMYMACARHGVRYVLEGHSFRTEGVSPLGNMYIDGAYVHSVHQRFGRRPMKSFPNMPFWAFMKWLLLYRIKKVRPLWYVDYNKPAARDFLAREYGWEYYGGHHLENRMSAFHHSYYNPHRFGLDQRNNSLSAAVRSGTMTREEAIQEYATPPHLEEELLAYFQKRLKLSEAEFQAAMSGPRRTYRDFHTYKRRFEALRPMFKLMADASLVPKSFYLKYCFPAEAPR